MALGQLWWRAWAPFEAIVAPAVCVAGVELGDIGFHFAWQAWRLVTSTFTLCGRRGAWRHRPSLCGWLWWRAWVPFDAVAAAAVCVAGVALGDIGLHFAWQAWRLWHWAGSESGGARGSRLTPLSLRLLVWQAWRLETSAFTLRGRRHRLSLCVAGVAVRRGNLVHPLRTCCRPSAVMTVCAFGHIAHAKTGGCHSPLLMVLAHRLWLHNMITPTTLVHTLTHNTFLHHTFAHTSVPHNSFTHTQFF